MPTGRFHRFILAGSALWCLTIIAAPVLGLAAVYVFFAAICHQDPLRSWHLSGLPLPVCIRCMSIYAGFFLATAFQARPNDRMLMAAAAATLAEFAVAQFLFDSSWLRSGTGLALGAAAAPFVSRGVDEMRATVAAIIQGRRSQRSVS